MGTYTPKKPAGAAKKKRIVGRGAGSGKGCTAGRGDKGQKSRSGGSIRPGFEGGQMPLYRRIARRGFSNYRFRKRYQIVNVGSLDVFDSGTDITRDALAERGLVKNGEKPVKVLGSGDLATKLNVMVDMVSAGAREKIVAAGGKVEPLADAVGAVSTADAVAPVDAPGTDNSAPPDTDGPEES